MPEVTKTLELRLVNPNAHKERKLQETQVAYRQALQAAFAANCTTQSAANDIVVEYDLSGYAKNALKKYVPQLCGNSYDADELADDHPIRFTNEGVHLDHKPQNHYEWYVKIPHHEDYHLWLPAGINPAQRDWLEALYAGDADMGENRLIERDGEWYLHITVTREIDAQASTEPGDGQTPVGVDIGAAALATVCHRDERGSPTAPDIHTDAGAEVRHLRKTYFTATRRLQQRDSERIAEEYGDSLWERIDHIIHRVSRQVVARAQQVDAPVLVLEDLTNIREDMDCGDYMNRRLHGWAFAKLHAQIRYKAAEQGVPVATVNSRNTSKECHACGCEGGRPDQATFRCRNTDCWVSEYQADINAALNIADRYRSGESHRQSDRSSGQKAGADDSATDGASLTGPQDSQADAETQQPTLGTNAS
jgi:IS605 OrfB family transposase